MLLHPAYIFNKIYKSTISQLICLWLKAKSGSFNTNLWDGNRCINCVAISEIFLHGSIYSHAAGWHVTDYDDLHLITSSTRCNQPQVVCGQRMENLWRHWCQPQTDYHVATSWPRVVRYTISHDLSNQSHSMMGYTWNISRGISQYDGIYMEYPTRYLTVWWDIHGIHHEISHSMMGYTWNIPRGKATWTCRSVESTPC